MGGRDSIYNCLTRGIFKTVIKQTTLIKETAIFGSTLHFWDLCQN